MSWDDFLEEAKRQTSMWNNDLHRAIHGHGALYSHRRMLLQTRDEVCAFLQEMERDGLNTVCFNLYDCLFDASIFLREAVHHDLRDRQLIISAKAAIDDAWSICDGPVLVS